MLRSTFNFFLWQGGGVPQNWAFFSLAYEGAQRLGFPAPGCIIAPLIPWCFKWGEPCKRGSIEVLLYSWWSWNCHRIISASSRWSVRIVLSAKSALALFCSLSRSRWRRARPKMSFRHRWEPQWSRTWRRLLVTDWSPNIQMTFRGRYSSPVNVFKHVSWPDSVLSNPRLHWAALIWCEQIQIWCSCCTCYLL